MGTTFSGTNLVAIRYATALLDMAAEKKAVEKVEKDLAELANMISESKDLQVLIENPLISRGQQKKGITAIAEKAKFQDLTINFLGTLADNRRLPAIEGVIKAYQNELRKQRGEVEAKVETAFALSAAQTKALQAELGKAMGTNVTLDVEVNKDLLGGMIVTIGSRQIDDSVRSKLERLQRTMSSGSNSNQVNLKEVS